MERSHFTLTEAADYLDVTPRTINNMVNQGRIKAFRPNRKRVYIYKEELDRFITSKVVQPKEVCHA